MGSRRFGAEEELLLVHPDNGQAVSVASTALEQAPIGKGLLPEESLTGELTRAQIETATRPCDSLEELGAELQRWRRVTATAAEAVGSQVAALATAPLPVRPLITSSPRYQQLVDEFGLTAKQQLTMWLPRSCGDRLRRGRCRHPGSHPRLTATTACAERQFTVLARGGQHHGAGDDRFRDNPG